MPAGVATAGILARMKRDRSGSGLPLVRRVFIDGQLAEFVHPTDGGDPFRRPVGASVKDLRSDAGGIASGEGSATIERSAPVQGQLVGRAVRADDAMLPIHVPLLRASCEGTGACCGLFHHVPATCEDRDAVRDLLTDDWDGPVPLPEMMFPAFDAAPEGPLNVVEVDGYYLDAHHVSRKQGGQAAHENDRAPQPLHKPL